MQTMTYTHMYNFSELDSLEFNQIGENLPRADNNTTHRYTRTHSHTRTDNQTLTRTYTHQQRNTHNSINTCMKRLD